MAEPKWNEVGPELLAALTSVLPILEAVRYTAGLGKNQMARVQAAREVVAKAKASGDQ